MCLVAFSEKINHGDRNVDNIISLREGGFLLYTFFFSFFFGGEFVAEVDNVWTILILALQKMNSQFHVSDILKRVMVLKQGFNLRIPPKNRWLFPLENEKFVQHIPLPGLPIINNLLHLPIKE